MTEDVVWPLGNRHAAASADRQTSDGLSGARVGFAWDLVFHGDRMWELIKPELARRWPTITCVGHEQFPNFHDKTSDDLSNTVLKEAMRAHEITAAVIGVGA
jgi:hypothetical protein